MSTLVEQLRSVGRTAVASGLTIGSGGNLSARDGEVCVVTRSGSWLDELTPEDFSVVRIATGELLDGAPRPTSELALHTASYLARPDVEAVVHLHPQTSVLLAALGHDIRLLTIDQVYYVRRVAVRPWIRSGTPELAADAAAALTDGCNCVVLGNHGCSVVAPTVPLAYQRAANLEQAALATLRMLTLGDTTTACPAPYAAALARENL